MKSFWLLIFTSALLFQYSCINEPENDYVYFKIKIDNIIHPDTISVNDTLKIKFYGFVGSNGCYELSKFEERRKPEGSEITVWGYKPNFETYCPSVIVQLRGTEYKIVINQIGLYQIKINQADNTVLLDSVYVQ